MLRTFLFVAALPMLLRPGQAREIRTIEANVPVSGPAWAVLERRLLQQASEAAIRFAAEYTRTGGTLVWRTEGGASVDDLPESFYNFPLLYALGGDERLRDLSFKLWHASNRQLTDDFGVLHRDFPKHADWFHIGEGLLFYYLLALADPTDHEIILRSRRFAGFYMNEDPAAANYDSALRIIRSPHSGSQGPVFGTADKAAPYRWSKGMASYGLPLEDIPGIRGFNDLKDPENAAKMGAAIQQRLYRGDVPSNIAATSLAVHAYLFTGEQKYIDWVKEYVGAWLERTRANSGITPDNVGLSGKTGEYHGGKWWGGLYGWRWPHGFYNIGMALHIGAANAMLVSGGDPQYLTLFRSNLEKLIALGKDLNGTFLVPYKKGDHGWFAYQPLERQFLASLWFMSMEAEDWQLIEKIRLAGRQDWHTATQSPFPNRGYAKLPEPREDCWNCDIEGLADWNRVVDIRNKEDRSHEAPWLRFLAGENPDYPEKILESSLGIVAWRWDQIRRRVLLLEYDPRGTEAIDPKDASLTKVHEHHWQTVNPVTTEALVQLTMGAPQIMYNGGLLHARVRYFDPARRRPGLPRDVAALVRKLAAGRTVVELVNLSPFDAREVMVQAGTFGEHEFTTVKFQRRVDKEPPQPDHFTRPVPELAEQTEQVNGNLVLVRLAPGAGVTLDMGTRRFVNRPSYALPWHDGRAASR